MQKKYLGGVFKQEDIEGSVNKNLTSLIPGIPRKFLTPQKVQFTLAFIDRLYGLFCKIGLFFPVNNKRALASQGAV